uniref:3-hydroxyisobutyryl-coenzyme A hydrolase n=1 Tax=Alexandrium catenella TaxID=2925 RepID=A0A7S1RQ06_ALECA|mmetsp:Transcript_68332/g.181864  ORF Transcript_68332/g.181864 Transcript_68332/m.181864 type:complete len:290 (+) Transcript_68332:51-920(+)
MSAMPEYKHLLVKRTEDGLEWLTLNRPDRMNACNFPMLVELREHFEALRYNLSVRCVILQGAGRGFCTGMDMKDGAASHEKSEGGQARARGSLYYGNHPWSDVVRKMRACPQPIIACVHGYAMGGGFALALGADIRVATAGTKFNVQMIRIGMTGGDVGISYALPRAVGQSVAAELMYTGRFITAERGERVGLVSEVYPDQAAMERGAAEMAAEMLRANADGLRFTKECLRLSIDAPSLESAMAVEDRQQMIMGVSSREHVQRVRDFAKRQETDAASSSIFHDGARSKL